MIKSQISVGSEYVRGDWPFSLPWELHFSYFDAHFVYVGLGYWLGMGSEMPVEVCWKKGFWDTFLCLEESLEREQLCGSVMSAGLHGPRGNRLGKDLRLDYRVGRWEIWDLGAWDQAMT